MKTEVIKLDINNIDLDKLNYAAQILKDGGLVAFPTETVYGLGANALDESAVKRIFEAKGRPSDNPLIVHIADIGQVSGLVKAIPPEAFAVMERFWPGPLTLVMEKSLIIPEVITAGLDTVAIRMPSHPVALALIKEAGIPIAAPSANTSGKPSPTSSQHVIEDLYGKVDVIIEAGCSKVGLESTVLDMTVLPPMILRPGGITPVELNTVLGKVDIDPSLVSKETEILKPRSPGMKYTHYSPKAKVIIIEGDIQSVVSKVLELQGEYAQKGAKVGILATEQTKDMYSSAEIISMGDRNEPATIAANLFAALREFDMRQVDVILAEAIESTGIGLAIMNRMSKAAGYNIIKV
ncbi:MAG: L-threonylcarbamoyladenylate synthase [Clostridia bacterium]|nr:L-threonylcarbamoyladenylate synthase [Clostridia bacterium]